MKVVGLPVAILVTILALAACGGGQAVDTTKYEATVTPILNSIKDASTSWESMMQSPKFEDAGWRKDVMAKLDQLNDQAQQLRGVEVASDDLKSVSDAYNKAADALAVFVSQERTAMTNADPKLILSAQGQLTTARGFIQNGNLLLERAKQGK